MRARLLFALGLVALAGLAQSVHGQSVSTSHLGLGFSPSSVSSVSEGVPVFTVGDEVWFEYYGSGKANVTILSPATAAGSVTKLPFGNGSSFTVSGGPTLFPLQDVPGDTPLMLYTFSPTDSAGTFTLVAESQNGYATQAFEMVKAGGQLQLEGYDVTRTGELVMNYTLGTSGVYGAAGCLVGSNPPSAVTVPVPASMGEGELLVTLNDSNVEVGTQELTSGNFSLSLTLSQSYGYTLNQSSAIVSRDAQVAQAPPATVSATGGSLVEALELERPLRTGEMALGFGFQSSHGSSFYDTDALVTGTGGWIWMQGCSPSTGGSSEELSLSSELTAPPSDWPRYAYVAYEEEGVPAYSVAPVTVEPSAIELLAPDGALLTDSQVYGSSQAEVYSSGAGWLYIVSGQYPVDVALRISQSPTMSVTVSDPYSVLQAQVPAGQVTVDTFVNGGPAAGVDVELTDTNGTVASSTTSMVGSAVFQVPPGNYTVSAVIGGANESSHVYLAGSGQSVQVNLGFSITSQLLPYLLLATAAGGAVASAFVWGRVRTMRRGRPSEPGASSLLGAGHQGSRR